MAGEKVKIKIGSKQSIQKVLYPEKEIFMESLIDNYLWEQFEDFNYGNGLGVCESLSPDFDLYSFNYDNETYQLQIGGINIGENNFNFRAMGGIPLSKKYRIYELSCDKIYRPSSQGAANEMVSVIARTQTSLLNFLLELDQGQIKLASQRNIPLFKNKNEIQSHIPLTFLENNKNSIHPLVSLWKSLNDQTRRIQLYDINKEKMSFLSKPIASRLHSLCQLDKVGLNFALVDYKCIYNFDTRDHSSLHTPLINIGENFRHLVINQSIFKQGRLINVVQEDNFICYDVRNPGECILTIEHHCQNAPTICTRLKNINDWKLDEMIQKSSLEQFEEEIDRLVKSKEESNIIISSSYQSESDILRASHLLYNQGHNGELIMVNNFQPLRKGVDIQNEFNFEVIKEINNSLAKSNLFNGLTRFRRWPIKLYQSNYESNQNRIRGCQLLRLKNKVFVLSLDNQNDLMVQSFKVKKSKEDFSLKDRNYSVKRQKFDWDENVQETCRKYEMNYLIHKKKRTAPIMDEEDSDSSIEELDHEQELKLVNIKSETEHKRFIDMRDKTQSMVQSIMGECLEGDQDLLELLRTTSQDLNKTHSQLLDQLMQENQRKPRTRSKSKVITMLEQYVDSNIADSRVMNADKINRATIGELKKLKNDKFYMTNGLINKLRDTWGD